MQGTATAVHGDVGSGATKKETSPRVIYAGSEGDWESTAPFVRLTDDQSARTKSVQCSPWTMHSMTGDYSLAHGSSSTSGEIGDLPHRVPRPYADEGQSA